MHSVVCIKQVPDSAQIRVHPVTNTIMRQGVPAIINPYDLFAIEEALRLKDKHGGRVTVITMGPPQAEPALRKALSFGCDDAVLITDKIFSGADTLATSYVLASAIRMLDQENPVNLVFTGKQTIDGDTAQVGPGIAKRMNLELLTYVSRINDFDLASNNGEVSISGTSGQYVGAANSTVSNLASGSNALATQNLSSNFGNVAISGYSSQATYLASANVINQALGANSHAAQNIASNDACNEPRDPCADGRCQRSHN